MDFDIKQTYQSIVWQHINRRGWSFPRIPIGLTIADMIADNMYGHQSRAVIDPSMMWSQSSLTSGRCKAYGDTGLHPWLRVVVDEPFHKPSFIAWGHLLWPRHTLHTLAVAKSLMFGKQKRQFRGSLCTRLSRAEFFLDWLRTVGNKGYQKRPGIYQLGVSIDGMPPITAEKW